MPKSNTLSVTRIFLYNWHRFSNHIIPVTDDLYITGENGTGKSTILDALQLVLIGNATQVHFNQAAQNERMRSTRTIGTYVLAKTDEEFLRTESTVAYIVLEFTDDTNHEQQSVGVCIEASADGSTERTHFLLAEALDPDVYVVEGRGRYRRDLRQILKNRRSAAIFDHNEITRYQGELLNRLGGLNPLFFELLGQALTFKPIYNVHDFVAKMILQPYRIDLTSMQEAQQSLREVEILVEAVKTQMQDLKGIVDQQHALSCSRQQHTVSTLLLALLQREEVRRSLRKIDGQIASREKTLSEVATSLEQIRQNITRTEQERDAAQQRLAQNDSRQQRDLLIGAIEDGKERIGEIQQRWKTLKEFLKNLSDNLHILMMSLVLQGEELEPLQAMLTVIINPTPQYLVTRELLQKTKQSHPFFATLYSQMQESSYKLKQEIEALQKRKRELQAIKKQLEQENIIQYPSHVERLREYITRRLGRRPTLVCELLSIPDERWQNAVEAQLGLRRFNLVVPSALFHQALNALDDARAGQHIYNVGLLDLERLQGDGQRPARPGSLAEKVETMDSAIRHYIDMVLGNIMTCESLEELRQHRRAVTAEVMVYNEATAYAIDPKSYRPLCIGSRARQSQLTDITRDLETIQARLRELAPQEERSNQLLRALERVSNLLLTIQPILREPLDERPIHARLAEQEEQLRTLNLAEVKDLEDTIGRCRYELGQWRDQESALIKKQGSNEEAKGRLEEGRINIQNDFDARSKELEQHRTLASSAFTEAETMLARYQHQALAETISAVKAQVQQLNEDIKRQQQQLLVLALRYNTAYPPGIALDDIEHEPFYDTELQRLEETELLEKEALIAQVRRQTEDQLRQDILHRLAEQIDRARRAFGRINAILATTKFHEKSYHLVHPVNEALRGYYEIIQASASLGKDSLYESTFYREHQEVCDRFFDILLRSPRTPDEQKEQDRLVDYRNYLSYDIHISNPNGRITSLAKTLSQRSGGETQTPFYVAIAASFASLYKVGEQLRRPTIRLAIFDEAFSKMDQRYIESALEIFRRFNLQIIVATPPDRCPYLGPRMHTSLALVLQEDVVRIEPLRRYLDELRAN